jgi:hypothetical protein
LRSESTSRSRCSIVLRSDSFDAAKVVQRALGAWQQVPGSCQVGSARLAPL